MTWRRWSAMLVGVTAIGLAAVLAAQQPEPATQLPKQEARERNLRTYTELLRSDIRTQKVALITELMLFTEAEDAKFWPIYREYELELSRIYDDRIRLIDDYSATYAKLTDAKADELVVKALDLEARRTALKQKYFAKLKTALSPRIGAKAVYIEHQLELLIDLQIASALPVMADK